MTSIRSRFTSAHLIALLALFVALGGSAYAVHLGKNAVKTKNIKNAAVTEAKLANGAVTAAKLAPGAVQSPTIVVRYAEKPLNDNSNAIVDAFCQPGEVATGGGGSASNGAFDIQMQSLSPLKIDGSSASTGDTPGAYAANIINPAGGGGSTTAFAYVLCMKR
jgi:hypothetical protein